MAARCRVRDSSTGRTHHLTAYADGSVVRGGGASIVVAGTYCTLTTIGHGNAGDMVGFTAASCGGPGSQVVAEGGENHGTVGTVTAAADDLDYAVIKFDPAKVGPTANFAGFAINGIGQTRATLDSRSAHKAALLVSTAVPSGLEAQDQGSSRRSCRRGNQATTGHRSPLTVSWSA